MIKIITAYIKGSKKHACGTIFGIAFSVIVVYFLLQCTGVLKNQAQEMISKGPLYDYLYVDEEEKVRQVGEAMKENGYITALCREASVSSIGNRSISLIITGYEGLPEDFLEISLLEGEYAKEDYEICIDEDYARMMDYQVGEFVSIACGDDLGETYDTEFVVTGIVSSYAGADEQYCNAYVTYETAKHITKQEGYEKAIHDILLVKGEKRTEQAVMDEDLLLIDFILKYGGKPIGIKQNPVIEEAQNFQAEDTYGGMYEAFTKVVVAAFGSMFLFIYCTIAISLNKRYEQFGVMRCVGATRGQLVKMFFIEECIYGIVGTVAGVVAGRFFNNLFVMKLLNCFVEVSYYVVPKWVLPAVLVLVFSAIFIAVCVVYVTMRKLTPLEMVHCQEKSAKLSGKKKAKKKEKSGGLVFEFAEKNVKRNRSRNALVAVVISVASLGLTVAGNAMCALNWHAFTHSITSIANAKIVAGSYQAALTNATINEQENMEAFWITEEQKDRFQKIEGFQNCYWSTRVYGVENSLQSGMQLIIYSDKLLEKFCEYNNVEYPKEGDTFACQVYSAESCLKNLEIVSDMKSVLYFPEKLKESTRIDINAWVRYGLTTLGEEDDGTDYIIINEELAERMFGKIKSYTTLLVKYEDTSKALEQCSDIISGTEISSKNLLGDYEMAQKQLAGMALLVVTLFAGLFVLSVFIVQNMNEENLAMRKKEFGMLMSIGAERKFIEQVLVAEFLVIGIKSSVFAFCVATPINIWVYFTLRQKIGAGWWGYVLNMVFILVLALISRIRIHAGMRENVADMLRSE